MKARGNALRRYHEQLAEQAVTLADLVPPDLRRAHQSLDKAVDRL